VQRQAKVVAFWWRQSNKKHVVMTKQPIKRFLMRVKEGSSDYRYFPEPDIPKFEIDDEWIEKVRANIT
jgi:Asp-tRNA(Asn)/Glu-tRNA(Gln) amidotransferase B subunit